MTDDVFIREGKEYLNTDMERSPRNDGGRDGSEEATSHGLPGMPKITRRCKKLERGTGQILLQRSRAWLTP